MQNRHETVLTAGEYNSREAWREARRPERCHSCGGSKIHGHGAYLRKFPVPFRVRRWRCAGCGATQSSLPDFAASRRPGALQEIEDALAGLARSGGEWRTALALSRVMGGAPSNSLRRLRGFAAAASAVLAVLVTALPELFAGCPAELTPMRERLGTESLLFDMRRRMPSARLRHLPCPVGFRPRPRRHGSQTGPPT